MFCFSFVLLVSVRFIVLVYFENAAFFEYRKAYFLPRGNIKEALGGGVDFSSCIEERKERGEGRANSNESYYYTLLNPLTWIA